MGAPEEERWPRCCGDTTLKLDAKVSLLRSPERRGLGDEEEPINSDSTALFE